MFDFDFLVYVYFWIALSGAVAVAAYWRERSATAWFIVSLLASPLVAAAYLFAATPPREDAKQPQEDSLDPGALAAARSWSNRVRQAREG
jgi:hypothetical protein